MPQSFFWTLDRLFFSQQCPLGILFSFDAILRIVASILLPMLAFYCLAQSSPAPDVLEQNSRLAESPLGKNIDTANLARNSEWMFAAYGGAPYTYPSDVNVLKSGVKDFNVEKVEWQGLPFTNPIYYGARVVHWFSNAYVGTMLDFTHSKAISIKGQKVQFKDNLNKELPERQVMIKEIFERLEASHGHNMLTFNGLFRLPSFRFAVSPYIGLGAGIALPHSEVHLVGDSERTYEYQMAGPVAQALVGIEIRLPRLSYFFEYKFTFADYRIPLTGRDGYILFTDLWKQFTRWYYGIEPLDGWLETKLVSHQAIGGLGVRLSVAPSH